jgi:hypothetical protein
MRKPKVWTPETDAKLQGLVAQGLSSTEIAAEMGMTYCAVKRRACRMGLRFERYSPKLRGVPSGHRAADERSAQILRQIGMRV